VLLPKKADGLAKFEKTLTPANLKGWLLKLRVTKVGVTFPKFTMTRSLELSRELARMGMPRAFDEDRADFSGINGSKGLFLTGVYHKTFVRVHEEGTEAASVSIAGAGKRLSRPNLPPQFVADHPFVFLIRDVRSGAILFMGRVTNPK
jgi:serpin B